ncbi:hypothetical protein D5S18_03025 [Nocardia panacis]|uniref:Capsid maturation protease n=1 Tax=Nocardia panacis TaxID=2340916 RepID=A0A3A4KF14_9NOCA|nr:hypothetical protein [Nocardia panacis]RJO79318.1 hypothetical protein D5S18_03025 [Nocardia panacis]
MTAVSDIRVPLAQLNVVMAGDLHAVWNEVGGGTSAKGWKHAFYERYPSTVYPYLSAAGDLTVDWYNRLAPDLDYRAIPAEMPAPEALQPGVAWALGKDAVWDLILGVGQRHLYQQQRTTVLDNTVREQVGAIRYAAPAACWFCRMIATRTIVYASEERASFSAHTNCRCVGYPLRKDVEIPHMPDLGEWEQQYIEASRLAGATDRKSLGKAYRELGYA